MLIDTHAHLASARLRDETESLVSRAAAEGVERIVTISTDLEDTPENLALAERFPDVYASVGIHPTSVHEVNDPDWLARLRDWAAHPKVVAIGEAGLDFYHPPRDGTPQAEWAALQERFFRPQIDLALELDLPLVIHTRESLDATLAVLASQAPGAPLRAVMHCFVGGPAALAAARAAGCHVSFTGVASFPKATELHETIAAVEAGTYMLETDSPFLAPVPYRGQLCEPAYTRHTAAAVARLRGETLEQVARDSTAAAEAFFRLPVRHGDGQPDR